MPELSQVLISSHQDFRLYAQPSLPALRNQLPLSDTRLVIWQAASHARVTRSENQMPIRSQNGIFLGVDINAAI